MEVLLHYRPSEVTPEDLHKIGAGSLEDFPVRCLPKFAPWFPHYVTSFILKPQRCPPTPEIDFSSKVGCGPFDPLDVESFIYYDPTPDLLEFQPNVCTEHGEQQTVSSKHDDGFTSDPPVKNSNVSRERTWSICTQKAKSGDTVVPPSEKLKSILEKFNLNLFHRGRWMILPSVCGDLSLDEVWRKLSRLLRHKVLPSCNATLQRDINQIWIFCDLRYCEHVVTMLRSEIKLTGKLDLFVRKHGIILSL